MAGFARRLRNRAAVRRFLRNRSAVVGALLLIALFAFSWLGPLLLSYDPNLSDFDQELGPHGAPPGPSSTHLLGTDSLFRDLLARLAHGGRLSLTVALAATVLTTFIGAAVGITAGMTSETRWDFVDTLLMRLVEVLLALPFLLFITAIGVALQSPTAWTILLVLGLIGWTGTARIIRAKTLQIRTMDYVQASAAMGASALRTTWFHVLPNTASTLVVIATGSVAQMILAEAVLGYLSVGVQPPTPSWGRMLHEAEPYIGTDLGIVAAPAFAILLSVLSWNRVGDGLRDALDPKSATFVTRRARRVPFDFVLVAAAALLVGAARPDGVGAPLAAATDAETPRRGGVLRLATFVNVRHLDPALSYDEASRHMGDLLFDRLVSFDRQGDIVGELASSFGLEADGRTHTFSLTPNILFHDGAELTAVDVKRSLERTLHPTTPSPAAHHYRSIVGYQAYRRGEADNLSGVRVTGKYTLEIELTQPSASFLSLLTLAFAAPVCPSVSSKVDPSAPAKPCGTGPFKLESFDPEDGARFARHEGYHRAGLPRLDAVEWLINVRPKTQRYRFEAGELSFVRDLTGTDGALFRASPAWQGQGLWVPKPATNAIFMNTEMPPFDDVNMRRAVYHAIDPSVLSRIRADVEPLDRILPPSMPGPARDEVMRTHDLARALESMAAAGYAYDPETGSGGYPEEIEYLAIPNSFEQLAGEVFQQQLARVGIRVKLRLVSFSTYLAEASRPKTTRMGWVGWSADYPDAENFFEPTLTSRAIHPDTSQNYAFFRNAELDELLNRASQETDQEARLALFQRAEEILRDHAPWAPTHVVRSFQLWHPFVRGLEPQPVLGLRLEEVWLAPREETP